MDDVTDPADSPLYEQVFRLLRDEIMSGFYDACHVLPSEKQLEERFKVSRITIRRAVEELERAGFAERARGKATRVADRRPAILADVDDELANMLAALTNLETTVRNFRWIAADKFIAAKLQITPGEKLLWIVRTRAREGKPVMQSVLYLPAWVGKGLKRSDLAAGAIVDLVRNRGVQLTSGEQTMSAAPCPPDVALRLDVAAGTPVFFIRRLIRNEQRRPVMFNDVYFRWDCFAYSMALEPARWRVSDVVDNTAKPSTPNGLWMLDELQET